MAFVLNDFWLAFRSVRFGSGGMRFTIHSHMLACGGGERESGEKMKKLNLLNHQKG